MFYSRNGEMLSPQLYYFITLFFISVREHDSALRIQQNIFALCAKQEKTTQLARLIAVYGLVWFSIVQTDRLTIFHIRIELII